MKPMDEYEALRRFRASLPHADYFLTMATADRQRGLTSAGVGESIRREVSAIEASGYWMVRGGVLMPDHVHLLVSLHDTLPLDRVIARFKAKTRPSLLSAGLRWQPNYYEHRLRTTEAIESVLMYIFLNPYRAKLITAAQSYPWFWLGTTESAWFQPQLDDHRPFADWLR
jgi:putative transposase